jgi:hypothetical protein
MREFICDENLRNEGNRFMTDYTSRQEKEGLEGAPQWLLDALKESKVPPEFRERCREAARVAHSIVLLRNKRSEVGFVPEPLDRYVRDLASKVKVKLEPVLEWLGLTTLAAPGPDSAPALVKLMQALGMSRKELYGHFVMDFSAEAGTHAWVPGKFPHGAIPPRDTDELIQRLELALSPSAKQKLKELEAAIAKEFGSAI